MKEIIMPLADGVEEIEAVTVMDTFVRAGWRVKAVGVTGVNVLASRGVKLVADCVLADLGQAAREAAGILVIPGGAQGVAALVRAGPVLEMAREFHASGRIVGAICAGPLVLHEAGLLHGRRITSYPSVASRLTGALWEDAPVVIDGKIVTSQGPGTAFDFALAMLELAGDREIAARVAADLLLARRPGRG